MGRIRQLPPGLVNRIAAGECVERPASVVKELTENAIDAGATQITIETEDGGRSLIRVTDDGCGMDADDLQLCLVSHATSKIRHDEDLFAIQTMGFRGEALPSIASVARIKITSRPPTEDVGHIIRVDAGELDGPTPTGCPTGTSVEVRDLFYCVPARRKFLRTNQTESGHITEQIARIALAHPQIAFTLLSNGRAVHRLPAAESHRQRISDLYGADLVEGLLSIRREGQDVAIDGYVALPAYCRRSNKWEYVFVNGRYVRDRFVSHAVREAYRSLIQNEYPVAFLYIQIDPAAIDVNVHPTKTEVRWRDGNYVHGQVLAGIREKFLTTNLDRPLVGRELMNTDRRERVRGAMSDFFARGHAGATAPPPQPTARADAAPGTPTGYEWPQPGTSADAPLPGANHPIDGQLDTPPVSDPGSSIESPTQSDASRIPDPGGTPPINDRSTNPSTPHGGPWRDEQREGSPPDHRALQLHNTYLVVETDEGVMIIDQHALHERVLYEEFRQRITERPLESQRLLLPDIVDIPADRLEVLESHADTLTRLGVELTISGPQAVAVQAFPTLLEKLDRRAFVRDLLDMLSEKGTRSDTESLIHELLDMMACKAAVKAGDPLTPDEITALLARRESAERSSHCPHGRPTTLTLTLHDLERQFKRR